MSGVWLKVVTRFKNFPVFAQVISIAFLGLFVFFAADAWFSPFLLTGYQLILYNLVVLALSAWVCHTNVWKLIRSPTPISWCSSNVQSTVKAPSILSLKDVCENELLNLTKLVADTAVEYMSDSSDDNQGFIREIQNHIEDIFVSLTEKLSTISVESFTKDFILILHNHVKNYKETQNTMHSSRHSKFPFLHPVTRGEISLDLYLNSISEAFMKEFVPGSIQDCSAIFELSCVVFCSQVLMKFIQSFSQPEFILESLTQFCQPEEVTPQNHDDNSEHFKKNCRNMESPVVDNQQEDTACGEPMNENSVSLCTANYLVNASQLDDSSYVQTGLNRTLPAATVPLLSSRSSADLSQCNVNAIRKPNSLPLLTPDETNSTCDATSPPVPVSLERDVSPVYEDVEDFATAIAKLRSLLEQRNASTGSESAGSKGSSFSTSYDNTRTGSSGGETEGSFEELLDASEQQLDSRIFLNIKIPRTEVCSVPNEGQHSVFCIGYDGIYSAVSTNTDDGQRDSRLVLKSRLVRRRFRQFLELHSKLAKSEDLTIVQAVRGIRGPSKWLNLPFSRLDQNTIAHRQAFLERYLQELVASPCLGISNELRQFLEYELHLNENTSAPSSAALQRVPFFAKTVTGVLQSIKTALPLTIPGFDNDQNRGVHLVPLPPPSPHSVTFDSNDEFKSIQSSLADDSDVSSSVACRITYSTERSKLEQMLCNCAERNFFAEPAFDALESSLLQTSSSQQSFQDLDNSKTEVFKSCLSLNESKTQKDGWDRFDDDFPLSCSLINLAVECLNFRGTWLIRAPVPLIFKVVFGQRFETFLQDSIRNLSNPDQISDSFRKLLHKIDNGRHKPNDQTANKHTIEELVGRIVTQLETQLPSLAVWVLGKQQCTDILRSTVSCFTDAQLNRDLALTLIDFLFSQLSSVSDPRYSI